MNFRLKLHSSLTMLFTATLALLQGCALESTAALTPQQGSSLRGSLHGGQQPVTGAQVYLLAAGTSGYGGASLSLITHGSSGSTAIGQYVSTGAGGSFDISGDYTCAPGSQVYILGLGGNPGLTGNQTNPALALMAALGNCPAGGTFAGSVPFINVDEVTTVAAVYSLSGYMTDATHVSSGGTALAQTGMFNAFATANNLVNIAAGSAYSVSPSTATGIIPQAKINTLGDLLQSCVNSTGESASPSPATLCGLLFDTTTHASRPANTVEAALAIARYPGSNVSSLFLQASPGAAFQPSLSVAPNDWTLGVTYTSANFGLSPVSVAVDAGGNIWSVAQDLNAVNKISNLGVPAAGSPFQGFSLPTQVAIDSLGNAWVTNSAAYGNTLANLGITKIAGASSAITNFTTGGIMLPLGVALDASNNVWTTNSLASSGSVSRITNAGNAFGTNVGPFGGSEEQGVQSVAVDPAGNAWTTTAYSTLNRLNATTGNLNYSNTFSNLTLGNLAIDSASTVWIADPNDGIVAINGLSGIPLTGSPFSGGGVQNISSVALDGANNVWAASYVPLNFGCTGYVSGITKTGAAITSASGYTTPMLNTEADGCVYNLAVDGSGNLWVGGPNTLTEFVGAAVPVHTPILNTALATRP